MTNIKLPVSALVLYLGVSLVGFSLPHEAKAAEFSVTFADSLWDGQKIPLGQQCKKFAGNGSTPPLKISHIPPQANAIIVEFNDSSYRPLSFDGGHGKIGWMLTGGTEAILQPVLGGEPNGPKGTWVVKKNRAGGAWKTPGYLPPCSGGRGNTYTAVVKAVTVSKNGETTVLAKASITLGRY